MDSFSFVFFFSIFILIFFGFELEKKRIVTRHLMMRVVKCPNTIIVNFLVCSLYNVLLFGPFSSFHFAFCLIIEII